MRTPSSGKWLMVLPVILIVMWVRTRRVAWEAA